MTTLASRQALLALAQSGQNADAATALRADWPDALIDLALDGVLTGLRTVLASEDAGGDSFTAWQNNLGKTVAVSVAVAVVDDGSQPEFSVGVWDGVSAFPDNVLTDVVAVAEEVSSSSFVRVPNEHWLVAFIVSGTAVGLDARMMVFFTLEDE